jgi:hypothetical protein
MFINTVSLEVGSPTMIAHVTCDTAGDRRLLSPSEETVARLIT